MTLGPALDVCRIGCHPAGVNDNICSHGVAFCTGRAILIFMLAFVGVFYPYNRGSLYTALVVIYALTSGIAGYTASSLYKQLEGVNWVNF